MAVAHTGPADVTTEWKDWVLDALADLIARVGPDVFLAAPIITPTSDCFVDPIAEGAVGVRTLARRMMRQAGLGELHVDLVDIEGEIPHGAPAIEFVRFEGNHALFDLLEVRTWQQMTGFLAFEIGRAYRIRRALDEERSPYRDEISEDPEVVRQLAGATAVYLGFGVLAANGARIHEDDVTHDLYTFIGDLPAEVLSWALAVQTVIREMDDAAIVGLADHQSVVYRRARRELLPTRDTLVERLGLPSRAEWPLERAPDRTPLSREEDDDALEADALELEEELEERKREGRRRRVVYRVVTRRRIRVSAMFMLLMWSGGAYALVGATTESAPLAAMAAVLLFGGVIFWLKTGVELRCSECREAVTETATHCPECEFRIHGTVDSVEAAEEMPEYD